MKLYDRLLQNKSDMTEIWKHKVHNLIRYLLKISLALAKFMHEHCNGYAKTMI